MEWRWVDLRATADEHISSSHNHEFISFQAADLHLANLCDSCEGEGDIYKVGMAANFDEPEALKLLLNWEPLRKISDFEPKVGKMLVD